MNGTPDKSSRPANEPQALGADLVAQTEKLKQLNQQLVESDQRLRLAIEAGRVGLWVWNSTDLKNPGDWSPRLKEIFGLPPETEVTHEIFLRCVHPDDRERVNNLVLEALKGVNAGRYETEYRIINPKDGAEGWVAARGQAFFAPTGEAVRFIGTLVDITERKTAEVSLRLDNSFLERQVAERTKDLSQALDDLRRSRAYLAEAQHLSATGSFGWNVTTGELYWSDETFCILGFDKTLKPNLNSVFERIHKDDLHFVKQQLDEASRDQKNFDFEHRLAMPDGFIKHVHVIAKPEKVADGQIEFVGAIMDVTERKRVAEELKTSENIARGQLAALCRTLDSLAQEFDPDKLPKHVLTTILTEMGAHSVTIWERRGDRLNKLGILEGGVFRDSLKTPIFNGSIPIVGDVPELWGDGLRSGEHFLIKDIDKDPLRIELPDGRTANWSTSKLPAVFAELKKHFVPSTVTTMLVSPMMMAGELAGMIVIRFTAERTFGRQEIELTRALAQQAMLAIQLMRLSQQSRESAIIAERNRFARDIHDTLAQGFTGVIMQLEAAKGATAQGNLSEASTRIERASQLARASLGEARRSIRALRPKFLTGGNLREALENLFKRMTDGTDISADFHAEGDVRSIPVEYEEGLLRIAQESLTNALKHASAKNIRGTLRVEKEKIQFQFVDDGKGFDTHAEYDGFGLLGMKERVEAMGGGFIIRSKPGEGTEIVVELKNQSADKSNSDDDQG